MQEKVMTKEKAAVDNITVEVADGTCVDSDRVGMPRIVGIRTDGNDDNDDLYSGQITIQMCSPEEAVAMQRQIELAIHPLKHCFMGQHEKVPEWIIDEYRARTSKHSRMAITYIVTVKDSQVVVNYYRSMASGASGAHRLHRLTDQNTDWRYPVTRYRDNFYYMIPLSTSEANSLMVLFGVMAMEVLEKFFAEYVEEGNCYDVKAEAEASKVLLVLPVMN